MVWGPGIHRLRRVFPRPGPVSMDGLGPGIRRLGRFFSRPGKVDMDSLGLWEAPRAAGFFHGLGPVDLGIGGLPVEVKSILAARCTDEVIGRL